MLKSVILLVFCCLLLTRLSVLTIASPSSGTVGAPSSTIFGPSAPGAAAVKPSNFLQPARANEAKFPRRKTFTSISFTNTRPYGGAITAQAIGNSDGSNGHLGDNGFYYHFSRKNQIITEFLIKKAKNLTTEHTNPEQIEAGLLELLLSKVALHAGHKVIYQGVMYSNTGRRQTERKDFQKNFKMQQDTLSTQNLKTIGPTDSRLFGAILGEWIMAKRPPKLVLTNTDGDLPTTTIVLDHNDLKEDISIILEYSEIMGKQMALKMDMEIDRLAKIGLNSKLEKIDEDRVLDDQHPYPNFKDKFDLGIFGWTFMAFGEKQVMDAIRLILLLRMLLDGQLTGQGLLDYLENKCVPMFRDKEKFDKYRRVLQLLAKQMGWYNHYEEYYPDDWKYLFVYRHKIFWKHGEQLKWCESF